MCNGAAVRSATLSNCRSDRSPANLGSKHCSLADLCLFTSGGAPETPGAALGRWAGLPARRDSVRVRRCERCRPGLSRGRRGSEGEEARATKRQRARERRPRPCRRRIPVSGLGKRQRHPRGPSGSGRASPRRAGDRPPSALCACAELVSQGLLWRPGSVSQGGWLRCGRFCCPALYCADGRIRGGGSHCSSVCKKRSLLLGFSNSEINA